jgi:hypothetical protein
MKQLELIIEWKTDTLENILIISYKVTDTLTHKTLILFLGIYPRDKNTWPHKHLYTNFQSSFTHHTKKL